MRRVFITPRFVKELIDSTHVNVLKTFNKDVRYLNFIKTISNNILSGHVETFSPNNSYRVKVTIWGHNADTEMFFVFLCNSYRCELFYNNLEDVIPSIQGLFDLFQTYMNFIKTRNDYDAVVDMLRGGIDAPNPQIRLVERAVEINTRFIDTLTAHAMRMYVAKTLLMEYKNKWLNNQL